MVTVNYVAEQLELVGNSMESTLLSTNKYHMRKAFDEHGDPSVRWELFETDALNIDMEYPVIVKPVDSVWKQGGLPWWKINLRRGSNKKSKRSRI